MSMHITFVVSPPLHGMLLDLLPELRGYCGIDVFVAASNEEAYQLYTQRWRQTDAFIFTGTVFMYSVTKRADELKRPCFAFDDTAADIRDILLRLVLDKRDMDFSRVFVDFAHKENNYLGLHQLLPQAQWPYTLAADTQPLNIARGDAYQLTEIVLQRHLLLHQEGRIDLSITRFGAIIAQLHQMGLPSIYAGPSREYVVNFLLQVINSLNQRHNQDKTMSAMAFGLSTSADSRQDELMAKISGAAVQLAAGDGFDFSLIREKGRLVVLTRYQDLHKLTRGFTSTDFQHLLIPVDTPVCLGLGSGASMFQAKLNALSALEIARSSPGAVHYISQDGRVVGPLGQAGPPLNRIPGQKLRQLAQHYHLDHASLQKVMSFNLLNGGGAITAEMLAEFMGVTVRTANRLLTKLLQYGGATSYQEHIGGGRGRPKNYYQITFAHLLDEEN